MKLNIEHIKNFLDCDEAFVLVLFKSYLTESSECINNIDKGLETKEWTLIKGAAHKMLSSTRIFDFKELTEVLIHLENYSAEEDKRSLIPELVNNLKKHQNTYTNEIKHILDHEHQTT